jgi:tetratricopeptide (TPR) repeat protein
VFTAEQLLGRLADRLDLLKGERDTDPRQQTLRATIEWSHELLDENEKTLFARLAVFVGGCTYEAAETIAGADPDTLQSLLDKNLVRRRDADEERRYWMLETIREYAVEQLDGSGGADELRRRHAKYYLALAESLPRDAVVSREWLDRMEAEHDNVRAAFDWMIAAGEPQLVLRLVGGSWRLWAVRGYHAEGMDRTARALAQGGSGTPAHAYALTGAAGLAVDTKEYDQGRRYAEDGLAEYRALGDGWGIARATFMVGYVAIESGDFERALPPLEEALELFAALDDEHHVQIVLFNLSWAYEELGDTERSHELGRQLLSRARASGDPRNLAFALDIASTHARDAGRLDEALDAAREGLQLRRDLRDIQHMLDGLSRVAFIHARAGCLEIAARLLSSSLHLHEARGMQVPLFMERRNESALELAQAGLDESDFAAAWEEGEKLTLDEAVALALSPTR